MKSRLAGFGACIALGAAALSSCAGLGKVAAIPGARPGGAAYPEARFMVISDPHVYDTRLGVSGAAFEAATAGSRVLYGLSAELLREAVTAAMEAAPDFVLLPGDLTKDGEPTSHALVLAELARLRAAGIRAYVIPGNHDLANPRARSFSGDASTALPSLRPEAFASLYAPFGYGEAISRDPRTLSYVAQLAPGLRLLAIDPFDYPKLPDPRAPEPPAAYSRETMAWIRGQLVEAERSGEAVIAMAHMSVLEHFEGQAKYFPETLPRGWKALAAILESHNVRLAFTGHFHIQDVAQKTYSGGGLLYDVATASLASYPMAYRVVEIGPGAAGPAGASIRSLRIASVPSMPEGLSGYARRFVEGRVSSILERKLESFFIPKGEAELIAERYAEAYLGLAGGDERAAAGSDSLPPEIRSFAGRLAFGRFSGLLRSIGRDPPPADNDVDLSLSP